MPNDTPPGPAPIRHDHATLRVLHAEAERELAGAVSIRDMWTQISRDQEGHLAVLSALIAREEKHMQDEAVALEQAAAARAQQLADSLAGAVATGHEAEAATTALASCMQDIADSATSPEPDAPVTPDHADAS